MSATQQTTVVLPVQGPFSLEESALFGFGHQDDAEFDGTMRLAFCLDGDYETAVGVEVRQDGSRLELTVHGTDDVGPVAAQVARVLSVDHDGEAFLAVGRRDPVIGRLQDAAPGLRPPQFHSPYEAAVWSIISARRPRRQGAQLRLRLARAHGAVFTLAGREVPALPSPSTLAALDAFPGIPPDRIPRIHAVAEAAAAGHLAVDHLATLEPDEALAELQELPGIGPFYAGLVLIRSCGLTDVLPTMETTALDLVRVLYELPATPTVAEFTEITEGWRPYRTWATVLVRAAAWRILPPDALPERERRERARR